MTIDPTLNIAWCTDPAQAGDLARFFAGNILLEYISHSELQGPRALDVGQWRPGLVDILEREIATRVERERAGVDRTKDTLPVLAASANGRLVGVALVTLRPSAPVPFAILEDVVVDPASRSKGIGRAILDWVTSEARGAGCVRMFLESGFNNHRAHEFFHREGFAECSVVMMKRF